MTRQLSRFPHGLQAGPARGFDCWRSGFPLTFASTPLVQSPWFPILPASQTPTHGSDLHLNLRSGTLRAVTRRVLERARLVFYVTPNLRAFMPDFDRKLRFLPNPVDVAALREGAPPGPELSWVLIFTRLDPVKGV